MGAFKDLYRKWREAERTLAIEIERHKFWRERHDEVEAKRQELLDGFEATEARLTVALRQRAGWKKRAEKAEGDLTSERQTVAELKEKLRSLAEWKSRAVRAERLLNWNPEPDPEALAKSMAEIEAGMPALPIEALQAELARRKAEKEVAELKARLLDVQNQAIGDGSRAYLAEERLATAVGLLKSITQPNLYSIIVSGDDGNEYRAVVRAFLALCEPTPSPPADKPLVEFHVTSIDQNYGTATSKCGRTFIQRVDELHIGNCLRCSANSSTDCPTFDLARDWCIEHAATCQKCKEVGDRPLVEFPPEPETKTFLEGDDSVESLCGRYLIWRGVGGGPTTYYGKPVEMVQAPAELRMLKTYALAVAACNEHAKAAAEAEKGAGA